jgi:hypothetical protein
MKLPKIHCKSVSYRCGFVEVRPNVHPGHVNVEIWSLHPGYDRRVTDIADDCICDGDVTGNAEIELDIIQAKELVRLLVVAIEAAERSGQNLVI